MLRIWPMFKIMLDQPGTIKAHIGSNWDSPGTGSGQTDITTTSCTEQQGIGVRSRCCQLRSVRRILGATWSCQESFLKGAVNTETITLCPAENHFEGKFKNPYWHKLCGVAENPSGDLGTPRIIAVATWDYQNSCSEQFVSTKNHFMGTAWNARTY